MLDTETKKVMGLLRIRLWFAELVDLPRQSIDSLLSIMHFFLYPGQLLLESEHALLGQCEVRSQQFRIELCTT